MKCSLHIFVTMYKGSWNVGHMTQKLQNLSLFYIIIKLNLYFYQYLYIGKYRLRIFRKVFNHCKKIMTNRTTLKRLLLHVTTRSLHWYPWRSVLVILKKFITISITQIYCMDFEEKNYTVKINM